MLIVGATWTAHGLDSQVQQIIWPNALLAVTAAWVLAQLGRACQLPVIPTWVIPSAVAVITIAVDLLLGPVAFAVVLSVPAAIGQISQLRAILRTSEPAGVSMASIVIYLANNVLWFAYAVPTREIALLCVTVPFSLFALANIVALARRRRRHSRLPDTSLPTSMDIPLAQS